jgi:hypothetical protein
VSLQGEEVKVMAEKKDAERLAPTFLQSVVKATDVRATMSGTGKMCSWGSYGK